jgi:hypothetical protein
MGGDAEMREKGGNVGVVQFVVDDEARIYGDMLALVVDIDGGGVPARPAGGLVERHVGRRIESPGGRSSRYA